jgi:Flp pilus assembly protein TadG
MISIKSELRESHAGAVTFEFIIVMVIFAVVIFAVLNSSLMDEIYAVVKKITDYVTNNNNPANELWVN